MSGCLKRPIQIQSPAAKRPSLRMPIGKGDNFFNSAIMQDGIRIQDQDILSSRRLETGIVARPKTYVRAVGNNTNFRKIFLDELDRTIRRPVIGHDHLEIDGMRFPVDRLEAGSDMLQIIPANDDYR